MVSPAQDLYNLAWLINTYPSDEGYVRRCISTAYYAVFRLIIDDGLPLLFSQNDALISSYHRKMDHKTIRMVCDGLSKGKVEKGSKLSQFAPLFKLNTAFEVHDDVVTLANAFAYLQSARETADYDMSKPINQSKSINVQDTLDKMDKFFVAWNILKTDTSKPQTLQTLVAVFLIGIEKIRT